MISLEGGILLERFLEPPRPRKFGPWGLTKTRKGGTRWGNILALMKVGHIYRESAKMTKHLQRR